MAVKKKRARKKILKFDNDSADLLLTYGLDVVNRVIKLGTIPEDDEEIGVDTRMVEEFAKKLTILNNLDSSPITIHLNTQGGDEIASFAIYDLIMASKAPVNIVVIGSCMSAGVLILQAGRERIMMPNSVFMTHIGSVEGSGHKHSMKRYNDFIDKLDDRADAIILKRINQTNPHLTKQDYDKMNEFDTYLLADEAITIGFADRLFDPKRDRL